MFKLPDTSFTYQWPPNHHEYHVFFPVFLWFPTKINGVWHWFRRAWLHYSPNGLDWTITWMTEEDMSLFKLTNDVVRVNIDFNKKNY